MTNQEPTTTPFKEAFDISSELVRNSILDFLYVIDGKQITSADFTPRNNSLDFEGAILPVLQKLCPSFQLTGSADFDSEGRIRYHLSWDMGTLQVPSFVIEESDRQFKDLMDILTFDDDDKEEGAEDEGNTYITWTNPYVHEESTSSGTKKRELDVYDFIPTDLI